MSTKTRKRLVEAKRKRASAQGSIYVGRNDLCPCGSGKKAKRCCLKKIQALEDMPPALREQVVVAKILGHFGEPQPVPAAAVTAGLTGKTGRNDNCAGEGTTGLVGQAQEAVVAPPSGPSGSFDFSTNGVQGR
jgi:hypothetical protein